MSWLERQLGQLPQTEPKSRGTDAEIIEQMSPGMDGNYDAELREKAGLHIPPPPPECMGLEGEYDETGLAKRVARDFDRDPYLQKIETVEIVQEGSTVVLQGFVEDESLLEQMTEVASRVDGAKAIDSSQVTIKAG